MKIKLQKNEVYILEAFVLDENSSRKVNRIKNKFLNGKEDGDFLITHFSDDEYLFLLECIENKICPEVSDIYDKLFMQDSKELIKPILINYPVI